MAVSAQPTIQQLYCFFLHRFIQKYSQAVYLVTFLESKLTFLKESVFRGLKLHVWSLLLINISIPKTGLHTNTDSHPFQSIQYREPVKEISKCSLSRLQLSFSVKIFRFRLCNTTLAAMKTALHILKNFFRNVWFALLSYEKINWKCSLRSLVLRNTTLRPLQTRAKTIKHEINYSRGVFCRRKHKTK